VNINLGRVYREQHEGCDQVVRAGRAGMSVDGVNPDRIEPTTVRRRGRAGQVPLPSVMRTASLVSLMNFAGGSLISFAGSLCAPGAPFWPGHGNAVGVGVSQWL